MSVRQGTSKRRFLGSKQGLLFLVFAAVIWTLSALSETYKTTVPIRLELQRDAENFVLLASQIEVPARVSSSGFSVLYRRIFPRKMLLSLRELPINNVENPTLDTGVLLDIYNKTYSNSKIINFVPATIPLPISQAIQKSFAPILATQPLFEKGFQLVSPLKFSTDSVSAFGSKAVLEQLQHATFELYNEKPLRSNFSIQATLLDSVAQLAHWSTTIIQVSGNVDRYSDVSMALTVEIVDKPEHLNVAVAPQQVDIKFAAPLKVLSSLDASNLSAVAVFEKSLSGQLTVQIKGLPETVKQLSVSPPTVSYFIVE